MVKAQPHNTESLDEEKTINTQKKKSPSSVKTVATKKVTNGLDQAKDGEPESQALKTKKDQEVEKNIKIQKKKELDIDEVKRYYLKILTDVKKDNDNSKHSINEFLVYLRRNSSSVFLLDPKKSPGSESNNFVFKIRPTRPERASFVNHPLRRYFDALQSQVGASSSPENTKVFSQVGTFETAQPIL
jgi:hypothetical protein